jgi:long-chain fatty acid transport protein
MRKMNKSNLWLAGMALAGTALGASPALAGGFYIAEQSVKGTGRAYSGEVADQGAESLWWNPASIGGLQGGSSSIGVSGILPSAKIVNNNTSIIRPGQTTPAAVGGDQVSNDPVIQAGVPSGAIAHSLTSKLAVGLAITAPFNFTTEYPTTSWTRYSALYTRLRTIDIQPSAAYMLTPNLSLGAGINIERVSANFTNAVPNASPLLPDGNQALAGTAWDVGYSVGMQYRKGPLSLGVSYKSAIKHNVSGNMRISGLVYPLAGYNMAVNTTANFKTPWQVVFGARLAAGPRLTLNAQATRFGWSEFSNINLGAPFNSAIPENYHDTWTVALGADYQVGPKWTLRAGVARDNSPVRNDQRDARVPDSNRWVLALGATHAFSSRFQIDAGAQYISLDSVPIDRNTAVVGSTILVDGTMKSARVVVLSLGARTKF